MEHLKRLTPAKETAFAHLKIVDLDGVEPSLQQHLSGRVATEVMLTCDRLHRTESSEHTRVHIWQGMYACARLSGLTHK